MAFQNKCVLVAFIIVYLFCNKCYCFNFTNVTGIWIVRQTSDSKEASACPVIKIKGPSNNTAITYQSFITPDYALKVNTSNTNIHPVRDSENVPGNLTIYGGILPFYIVASVKIQGKNATYFVLTGRIQLPEKMERNITEFLKKTPELNKIRFNSTTPESIGCRRFITSKDSEADASYPDIPPEMITWPAATTMKPITSTNRTTTTASNTTKKPGKNIGSELYISNFVVVISMLFVFTQ